ncbi:sugar ABC transporter substrate-binding protein [Actinacidiphila glaucinigra]|uniref:ABC transporter substrate-binding protein n=1 Tax=Actinacidiphila glaucinigra TaxID=235986 RepID=UPI0033AE0406
MSVRRSVRGPRGLRAAGAAVAALALLAAGCGGGDPDGGTVTIRYSWWGAQDRAELIRKTIALFEKDHPHIKVKTDFAEYADFWSKFNTQAAGGNAPDVFQNSVAFLRKYGEKNLLLDLNAQVEAGNLGMDDFRAGLDKAGEVDGRLLGVPVGGNTFALVYNPKAFERVGVTPAAGWTWDEFDTAVRKISAAEGDLYGASDNGGVMYLYDLYLRQNGKAFFTADKKLGFTEADLRQWWGDHYADNKAGDLVPAKKSEQIKPKSSVSGDLSAAEFTWDNFIVRYAAETDTELALAPVPTTDGTRTGQYISSLMLSGSARTQHPEEVAEFIDFMVHDPEVGKIMGYNRGVLPTNAQFEAYEPTGVDAQIAAYEKSVTGVIEPITPHPAGADVAEAAFLRIYAEVALGKTSVDDAVTQFFSEAKTALRS